MTTNLNVKVGSNLIVSETITSNNIIVTGLTVNDTLSANTATINTTLNANNIIATSSSSFLNVVGDSETNAATQIFYYDASSSPTLTWQIGPNFTGWRGGVVGIHEFLFDNTYLWFNQAVIQFDNPITAGALNTILISTTTTFSNGVVIIAGY